MLKGKANRIRRQQIMRVRRFIQRFDHSKNNDKKIIF